MKFFALPNWLAKSEASGIRKLDVSELPRRLLSGLRVGAVPTLRVSLPLRLENGVHD